MTTTDDDLGTAARAGLESVPDYESGPAQPALDDVEYTHLAFLGMGYQTLTKDIALGQEFEFQVRARVVEVGDKLMKDQQIRHVVKCDVVTVVMEGDPNPMPPSGE